MSRHWVFLADPTDYGWDELVRDGRTPWDGVTNARAQSNLRTTAHGDIVLVYHTAPDKALVGTARVVSGPRPNSKAAGQVVVDVEPVQALARRLALAELKADAILAGMSFVRMPRVAIQPVSNEEWDRVMELSGTDPGSAEAVDPGETGGP